VLHVWIPWYRYGTYFIAPDSLSTNDVAEFVPYRCQRPLLLFGLDAAGRGRAWLVRRRGGQGRTRRFQSFDVKAKSGWAREWCYYEQREWADRLRFPVVVIHTFL
jgi:hypothetical protein